MSEENLIADNTKLVRENHILRKTAFWANIATVCVAALAGYLALNQQVIIMPPGADIKNKTAIGRTTADNEYLTPMADFIINRTMNVTPSNVIQNLQSILYLVSPEYYGSYKTQLETQAQFIKMNNISQSFFINKTEFTPNTIAVYGLITRSVGKNDAPSEEAVVEITYVLINSKFILTGIQKYTKKDYQNELVARKNK